MPVRRCFPYGVLALRCRFGYLDWVGGSENYATALGIHQPSPACFPPVALYLTVAHRGLHCEGYRLYTSISQPVTHTRAQRVLLRFRLLAGVRCEVPNTRAITLSQCGAGPIFWFSPTVLVRQVAAGRTRE